MSSLKPRTRDLVTQSQKNAKTRKESKVRTREKFGLGLGLKFLTIKPSTPLLSLSLSLCVYVYIYIPIHHVPQRCEVFYYQGKGLPWLFLMSLHWADAKPSSWVVVKEPNLNYQPYYGYIIVKNQVSFLGHLKVSNPG